MPSRRYHTTGQSKPHVVATGYRYGSDPNTPLVRDEFTLAGYLKGVGAVGFLLIVAGIGVAVFS